MVFNCLYNSNMALSCRHVIYIYFDLRSGRILDYLMLLRPALQQLTINLSVAAHLLRNSGGCPQGSLSEEDG